MAIGKQIVDNITEQFNLNYQITRDMSGWDKTTIQVVGPISGVVFIYGTDDAGARTGVTQGDAELALNFTPIQATNLATGAATNSIAAAGLFKVDVNAQFLRLQGNPAATPTNIYRLLMFNSKIQ